MPSKQNFQPLLDIRQNQLNLVFSASDSLDSKALGLLAANVAVLIFMAQMGAHPHPLGLIVASVLLVISFVCNVATVWSRDYVGNVDIISHPEYLTFDEEDLTMQLLADTEAAITVNSTFNATKWRLCALSLFLSIAGSALLTWCIL